MPHKKTVIAIVGYALICLSIPFLRAAFLRYHAEVLFWILFFEHLVMIPLSMRGFAAPGKKRRSMVATGSVLVLAAGLLFVILVCTVRGVSENGVLVFLLFPAVEAVVALVGVVLLLAGLVGKYRGKDNVGAGRAGEPPCGGPSAQPSDADTPVGHSD